MTALVFVCGLDAVALVNTVYGMHFEHQKAGYALDYPDSWTIDKGMLAVDGPLFLYSFSLNDRKRGGVLPPGGMEIEVIVLPLGTDESQALVPNPTVARALTRSVRVMGGVGVLRADYDFEYSEGVTYHMSAVAAKKNDRLFIIQLTYDHPQPNSTERDRGEAALTRIISGLSTVRAR